jgi:hypothetical protein
MNKLPRENRFNGDAALVEDKTAWAPARPSNPPRLVGAADRVDTLYCTLYPRSQNLPMLSICAAVVALAGSSCTVLVDRPSDPPTHPVAPSCRSCSGILYYAAVEMPRTDNTLGVSGR